MEAKYWGCFGIVRHEYLSTIKDYGYQSVVNLSIVASQNYVLLSGQPDKLTVGTDTNEVGLLVAPELRRN